MKAKHIAIFASGGGSNALKILQYFDNRDDVKIKLIITNKKNAGVISHAQNYEVPVLYIDRVYFYQSNDLLKILKHEHIDLIVLAGFLWLIPRYLIETFHNRIINIHPSLLPKYGGKGMYGHHVHEAVYAHNEVESGMTIHFVDEHFDEGNHIFQAKTELAAEDTPEKIASKVLALEHLHYPRVIEEVLRGL